LNKINIISIFLLLLHAWQVTATGNVPSLNNCPDMIFIDGNENNSLPSNGFGGSYPGAVTHTINSDNTYYYYIPSSYQPNEPMPLMAVWHGAAGTGAAASAAMDMRDYWQSEAETFGFILVAQAATGATGGWIPNTDSARLASILDDMQARYNIETTRRYAWGFSAGGFVMHAIGLNAADYFAAYAVSGAHLGYANGAGYPPANAVRNLPVYISVGTSDSHHAAALADINDFLLAGWTYNKNLWFEDFVGGHVLPDDVPAKAWNKICIATILD
jgi:hypothetical protein